jgi:hypothetical protein
LLLKPQGARKKVVFIFFIHFLCRIRDEKMYGSGIKKIQDPQHWFHQNVAAACGSGFVVILFTEQQIQVPV